jgi:hypothetical protein
VQLNTRSSISVGLAPLPPSRDDPPRPPYQFIRTHSIGLPGGALYSAASDPPGSHIALASLSGSITILTSALKQSTILSGHALACRDVCWTSAGLVSCGFDRTIRIWDVEKSSGQVIETSGLAHSVCRSESDPNSLFAAAGDQILWIDKRRSTPITIAAGSPATAVTAFDHILLFGGYSGAVSVVDRRALQSGRLATVAIGGRPLSALSKCLPGGVCVAMSAGSPPHVLEVGDVIEQRAMEIEAPGRFGCRADITGRGMVFRGRFAAVCGGKMAAFVDGDEGASQAFESQRGFQYGAIFMSAIAQKILTYSEDGVVALWVPHS